MTLPRYLAAALIGWAVLTLPLAAADTAGPSPTDSAAIERGAYLFNAGDCAACHTDSKNKGAPLAGGRALSTAFGTFYGPNITPDRATGIGDWSLDDFRRALREGKGKHGEFLFPVFPFPSFSGMSDQDISDLYAFLMSAMPVKQENKPHDVGFPFGIRPLQLFWRWLFFTEGPLQSIPAENAEWNRGRYLAEAVAHCGECHTPRNLLGGLDKSRPYAGNPHGPDGQDIPNITSDDDAGIGKWSVGDIEILLEIGQTPDLEYVGKGMGEVVTSMAKLTKADRHAIAVYIKSLKPIKAPGK